MVFKGINEDGGWITVEYAATWSYGFDFMLDAARVILFDFGADLQRVTIAEIAGGSFTDITEEVMDCKSKLRKCESLGEECGVLAVAGVSGIMECPIQVKFYNQTNTVVLDIPVGQIPDNNPIKNELSENAHIFDNYMNSVEIKAYCADTERRTLERINGN
ncbi:MAG: hypothetical protein K2N06_02740 [Oscillospiraceae bacterium]|nr:hypothetical protein [Oscillospiraceae bacterium]